MWLCWGGVDICESAVVEAPGPQAYGEDAKLLPGQNDGGMMLLGGALGAIVLNISCLPLTLVAACSGSLRVELQPHKLLSNRLNLSMRAVALVCLSVICNPQRLEGNIQYQDVVVDVGWLMVEDMPFVVACEAPAEVVLVGHPSLVGHASLGWAEGKDWAYPHPAVHPCKVFNG